MQAFGKTLILLGLLITAIGALLYLARGIPFLGRLPGDIIIQRKDFALYFPLMTSLLLSLILSVLFYFLHRR